MDQPFPYIFRRGPWIDLIFWLVYGLFWHVIFSPNVFAASNLTITAILTSWQAVATYSHHRFLLEPRANNQLSILPYILAVVLLVCFCSTLSGTSLYAFFITVLTPGSTEEFLGEFRDYWLGSILGGMTMAVATTGAIYLFGRRLDLEKQEREREFAHTQTELAYLRGQLNPHFLFNALNSIYVLIPRDPDMAQEALGGFSDLLRYQLYRSERDLVPLTEELDQLQQFAELSRLRFEEDLNFALHLAPHSGTPTIPPMLLLPLLENAFKYCPKMGGRISGEAKVTDGKLFFSLENNVSEKVIASEASGIGLSNIRRRLEILFPGNYRLETEEQDGQYSVHLEIPTTE
ncbi:sensor histidine kinase [Neolewinella agarilytica]|uniref:Histidine kinase n=1 Tax=Neolewinella agarilytica TaxID=478744 RepID=A0A1H8Z7J2_9BACT|nr:histidine kinase [Neolewinella agarilytica]SEP60207.1 Histidine kinase [Neolewinella agarilytica]